MVTYISKANADKYRILFEKASQALKDNTPEYLQDTVGEDFLIGSLNEYFGYLEDLVKLSDDDDTNRFFVRLPLDEDFFVIDANSRTVTVPNSSFGRYGVGVQGDEMAEVVYFTIDRYFDSMDLANDNMNIIIQWEARDANRQTIRGISRNFGKDIESVPGKIIFGWPISSELTKVPGSVRFAVRFYQLSEANAEDPEEERTLVYSLATLPADVVINATLDYDLINKAVEEIDHGKVITSRIKNVGIYDPSVPVPGDPIVTTALQVMTPEGYEDKLIVDLIEHAADEDGVTLGVSAKPADIGVIGYNWKKYGYDNSTGNYSAAGVDCAGARLEYVKVESDEDILEDQEYYKEVTNGYQLIDRTVSEISKDDDIFYVDNDVATLYKKMSILPVETVGEYGVEVQARAGANTTVLKQNKRIRVPGPLKPVIVDPEESENISVTDNIVHVIADAGSVTLAVSAVAGEEGKSEAEVGHEPQVSLSYQWKEVVDNDSIPVAGATIGSVAARVVPADLMPTDPAFDREKAQFNQEHVFVVQNGDNVNIYATAELQQYTSTDEYQATLGDKTWVALDIDTGEDHLDGVTWRDGTLTAADEAEAEALGLEPGHVIFWAKMEDFASPAEININDVAVSFKFSTTLPAEVQYSFNEDADSMTISGIPATIDALYYADVTSTRNNVSTTESSKYYRVTNKPQAPVISYQGLTIETQPTAITFDKTVMGNSRNLVLNVQTEGGSDNLTYLWFKMVIDNANDYDENEKLILAPDLNGALSDLLGNTNREGTPDAIVTPEIAAYENGEIVFTGVHGENSFATGSMADGYYYCVVINELNNNKAAAVSPVFVLR